MKVTETDVEFYSEQVELPWHSQKTFVRRLLEAAVVVVVFGNMCITNEEGCQIDTAIK